MSLRFSDRAATSVQDASTVAGSMPAATIRRMPSSRTIPAPAIVPFSRRPRPKSSFSTGWPPNISGVWLGRPAVTMASVTPTARPGAAAKTILTAAASTCWPSMIVPMKKRSSVITAPGTPGSRWLNGRWALKMWVVMVAPASAAAQTCSAEASECPTDTMIPSPTSRRIASRAWSRSGARVTVSSVSFVAG